MCRGHHRWHTAQLAMVVCMTGRTDKVTAMAVADRKSQKTLAVAVAVAVAVAAVVVDRCTLIFKTSAFR